MVSCTVESPTPRRRLPAAYTSPLPVREACCSVAQGSARVLKARTTLYFTYFSINHAANSTRVLRHRCLLLPPPEMLLPQARAFRQDLVGFIFRLHRAFSRHYHRHRHCTHLHHHSAVIALEQLLPFRPRIFCLAEVFPTTQQTKPCTPYKTKPSISKNSKPLTFSSATP